MSVFWMTFLTTLVFLIPNECKLWKTKAPADVSVLPLSHWHNGTVFFLLQWMLTIWREWESEKCQHLTNDSFLPNIYCTNKPGSFTFLINLVNGRNRNTHRTNPKTCGFRCLYVYYKLCYFFLAAFFILSWFFTFECFLTPCQCVIGSKFPDVLLTNLNWKSKFNYITYLNAN